MKIGLVLEGGAMRGMYTAAILDEFLENNIYVDGIIGVSAGVLFGVNYLSKQNGRAIRYNKKYSNDKRYMGIGSLLKTGNIINEKFAYYDVPLKLDIFDEEEYKKSNIDFWATVTNVNTGKPEYLKVVEPIKQMELLRATSAMPFVSKIVEYNGEKYLDGGIADSIPIEKCIEMGYDKIIVVLTRPAGYKKQKSNELLPKLKYRNYPKLIECINKRYMNYNDSLEKVEKLEKDNKVFVFRPSKKVDIKRVERDANKLQEMYDLGINDFENNIEKLQKFIKG